MWRVRLFAYWNAFFFLLFSQRLLGLSTEDLTLPLDIPKVVVGLKTRLFEGPKSIELEPLGCAFWLAHWRQRQKTEPLKGSRCLQDVPPAKAGSVFFPRRRRGSRRFTKTCLFHRWACPFLQTPRHLQKRQTNPVVVLKVCETYICSSYQDVIGLVMSPMKVCVQHVYMVSLPPHQFG